MGDGLWHCYTNITMVYPHVHPFSEPCFHVSHLPIFRSGLAEQCEDSASRAAKSEPAGGQKIPKVAMDWLLMSEFTGQLTGNTMGNKPKKIGGLIWGKSCWTSWFRGVELLPNDRGWFGDWIRQYSVVFVHQDVWPRHQANHFMGCGCNAISCSTTRTSAGSPDYPLDICQLAAVALHHCSKLGAEKMKPNRETVRTVIFTWCHTTLCDTRRPPQVASWLSLVLIY